MTAGKARSDASHLSCSRKRHPGRGAAVAEPELQRRLQLREADRARLEGLGASEAVEAVFTALPNHQCKDGAAVRQYQGMLVYMMPMQ
jgi:hypothetical protein